MIPNDLIFGLTNVKYPTSLSYRQLFKLAGWLSDLGNEYFGHINLSLNEEKKIPSILALEFECYVEFF